MTHCYSHVRTQANTEYSRWHCSPWCIWDTHRHREFRSCMRQTRQAWLTFNWCHVRVLSLMWRLHSLPRRFCLKSVIFHLSNNMWKTRPRGTKRWDLPHCSQLNWHGGEAGWRSTAPRGCLGGSNADVWQCWRSAHRLCEHVCWRGILSSSLGGGGNTAIM